MTTARENARPLVTMALALLVGLLLSSSASAQDACEDRFVPDRPGATNAHTTVGERCFHLATSLSVTRQPALTSLSFPSILRYGLGTPFEVRLGYGIANVDLPDDDDGEATGAPLSVELKWMALEAAARRPGTGIMATIAVPTDERSGASITPALTWLFDWSFVAGWGWSVNLIGSVPPGPLDDVRRAARLDYGTVLSAAVPVPGDWLSLYVDGAGGSALRDFSWTQAVGGGAAFLVRDNVQLDASVNVEVTGDDHPVVAGVGVAWRL